MINYDIQEVEEKNSDRSNINNIDTLHWSTDSIPQLSQVPSSTTKQTMYDKQKELIKRLLDKKNSKGPETPSCDEMMRQELQQV